MNSTARLCISGCNRRTEGLELAAEMEEIPIVGVRGGFGDIHFSRVEKILGFPDAHHGHILIGRHARHLLKEHSEMAGAALRHGVKLVHGAGRKAILLKCSGSRIRFFYQLQRRCGSL